MNTHLGEPAEAYEEQPMGNPNSEGSKQLLAILGYRYLTNKHNGNVASLHEEGLARNVKSESKPEGRIKSENELTARERKGRKE
jgi:hypothetical protein